MIRRLTIALLLAALATGTFAAAAAQARTTTQNRWCDTATIRIDGYARWLYGGPGLKCRTIHRRARALILRNYRPAGYRCKRYRGSDGQWYGSCWHRNDERRYYGVSVPH